MSNLEKGITAVAVAIVGVAMATVLVSQKYQTPAVLSSAGGAFSGALSAAQGNPVG